MAISSPKKKKLIVILIVILGLVDTNLGNDINGSLEETVARQFRDGMKIFDGTNDGDTWNTAQTAVYNAMEAIADAYAGTSEFDLESLSGVLEEALNGL